MSASVPEGLRHTLRGSALVLTAAPGTIAGLAVAQTVKGGIPAALLWIMGRAGEGRAPQPLVLLLTVGVLLLLADTVQTCADVLHSRLGDLLEVGLGGRFIAKTAHWPDLALHEQPELVRMRMDARLAQDRARQFALQATNLGGGLLALLPLVALAASVSMWLPLCIIVSALPSVWFQLRTERRTWDTESARAGLRERIDALATSATAAEHAKDVRAFRMASYLTDAWRRERTALLRTLSAVRSRGSRLVAAAALISSGGSLLGVWLVTRSGGNSAGDLVLTLGLLLQLRQYVYVAVANLADLGRYAAPLSALARFAGLPEPPSPTGTAARPGSVARGGAVSGRPPGTLVLDAVGFAYPGAASPVLHGVTATVPGGRTTAVVGPNGAGKSTLVKLLCGLYAPTSGAVAAGGIAAMHQDFARFPLTVRENLACGADHDDADLWRTLRLVGLAERVDAMESGLDTRLQLGAEQGGAQLSGGQWQRLALARTVLRARDSTAVLLDEPTSALDPLAEHQLLDAVAESLSGATVLLVTHRLSRAALADHVLVVQDGTITAAGAPAEVHRSNAWYRESFARQKAGYLAH